MTPRSWSSRSSARSIRKSSTTPKPTGRRTTPPTSSGHTVGSRGVDLGLAQPIEVNVDALREALRDPRCNDVSHKARAIDARVMAPLRAAIGDATRLLVAPDGDLNLVPFDAFVDEAVTT